METRRDRSKKPFKSHTALYISFQRPSTPSVNSTIHDWTIYEEHFNKPSPLTLNAINNESDGVSQSLADEELRQRYDSKNCLSLRVFC